MAQGAVTRWYAPALIMFGPPDHDSPNDELRCHFVGMMAEPVKVSPLTGSSQIHMAQRLEGSVNRYLTGASTNEGFPVGLRSELRSAASTTFSRSIARVMGPTPPGLGENQLATVAASGATSP